MEKCWINVQLKSTSRDLAKSALANPTITAVGKLTAGFPDSGFGLYSDQVKFLYYRERGVMMAFQIGDKVIHRTFGMGEITRIEEKTINGHQVNCYVVSITDMTDLGSSR